MRGAVFALIAVAVLAAAGAAFFANRMMSGPRVVASSDLGEPMPVAGLLVLVAATDIDPGKALGSGAMRWQPWPDDMVRTEYVTTNPVKDDGNARKATVARFEGLLARRHIAAGEPLTDAKVFDRQTVGFLAGALNSGMRAMSVAITAESGAGGFVLPGDQVDVILSHDITRSLPRTMQDFGSDAGVVKNAAETVLENIRVLAVDQTVSHNADGEAVVAKTATLEVMPQDAQVLALAANMGSLSLALRSLDAPTVPDDSAPISDVDVSPVLARAMASAVRRSEAPTNAGAVGAPAAAPAKPAWSVSIYRGGVSRVQTIDAR
ncbi:MAG: Flp pilus assembly protein CpaB [Rhodospirillaceae bacterium]